MGSGNKDISIVSGSSNINECLICKRKKDDEHLSRIWYDFPERKVVATYCDNCLPMELKMIRCLVTGGAFTQKEINN